MPAERRLHPVVQVRDEHGGSHGRVQPGTAADAVLGSLTLVPMMTGVVRGLVCVHTQVMHVPYACLCGVVSWTAPRTGDGEQVEAGSGALPREGHTNSGLNPALGPWL